MVVLSFQSYEYPEREDIDKRIKYLERTINEPLHKDAAIMRIGKESSLEFMLFSYAYSSYALTNIAVRDSTYKDRAVDLIKESITKVLDRRLYSPYYIDTTLTHLDSIPDYSVLYLGHLNLMIGCYRLLSDDESFNTLNDKISESLYRRYNDTEFMNLESYASAIWVPDNTVAIASLKLHGVNTGSGYDSICSQWVDYAKEHYIDEDTGVLYSTIDPVTGNAKEEPRGSMLGWSIMFIYQFDSEFAIELYNNYKKHFSNNLLVFRLFSERYNNMSINPGDIDSGPVILGYSIPANEFALGGAVLAGDYRTAKKIERLISLGANTIERKGEKRYKLRFIDMNISPMAEALVLHSLTMTKWTE
jgi:hypothetical protein